MCPSLHAGALLVDLSEEQIKSALSFHEKQKVNPEMLLAKTYTTGSTDMFADHVIVRTKWYKLAHIANIKASQGLEFPVKEQAHILDDPSLQIDIIVYGYTIDFAGNYTVMMTQGSCMIAPEKLHADHFDYKKKSLKGFPTYRATIRAYFSYSRFDPTGKATLVLKKDGAEKKFTIDFSQFN